MQRNNGRIELNAPVVFQDDDGQKLLDGREQSTDHQKVRECFKLIPSPSGTYSRDELSLHQAHSTQKNVL